MPANKRITAAPWAPKNLQKGISNIATIIDDDVTIFVNLFLPFIDTRATFPHKTHNDPNKGIKDIIAIMNKSGWSFIPKIIIKKVFPKINEKKNIKKPIIKIYFSTLSIFKYVDFGFFKKPWAILEKFTIKNVVITYSIDLYTFSIVENKDTSSSPEKFAKAMGGKDVKEEIKTAPREIPKSSLKSLGIIFAFNFLGKGLINLKRCIQDKANEKNPPKVIMRQIISTFAIPTK